MIRRLYRFIRRIECTCDSVVDALFSVLRKVCSHSRTSKRSTSNLVVETVCDSCEKVLTSRHYAVTFGGGERLLK